MTRCRKFPTVLCSIGAAGLTALLALILLRRAFLLTTVEGISMEPTLSPGQRVLMRRGGSRLRVGDVVLLRMPLAHRYGQRLPRAIDSTDAWLIKRIVAMPGDRMPLGAPGDDGARVPEGYVAVFGDAPVSLDSREWGCVPLDRIVAVMRRAFAD